MLLQIPYTVRSERPLMEQMQYNLLLRWFVGLTMDEGVWDASTFSANRDRLLNQTIAREFFGRVLALAQWQGIGGMRKTRFIGQARVSAQSLFTFAAYNLVRIDSLLGWRHAAPA